MSNNKTISDYRLNQAGSVASALIHLSFVLFSLICIAPVILVVIVSFTNELSVIRNGFKFWPEQWSLEAYQFIFRDASDIFNAYGVSIGITVAGMLVSLVVMGLYAYPLSRRELPYRSVFTFLLVFTMLFNGGLVTKYLVYMQVLQLKDSYMALILPMLMVPFHVIIMRTFFQNTIHPALIESAKIDGASEIHIFRSIILPLSLPVFATIGLFSTISYWNDWFNAMLFITKEHMYPLQYLMVRVMNDVQYLKNTMDPQLQAQMINMQLPGETLRMSMVVIGMGPIVIAYPFFQKYFIRGLTVGSVKG